MAARQREGLFVERAGREVLVYDESANTAHALNPTAAVVFELCDGATSIDEMTRTVAERCGLPADAEIVRLALDELADAGLVTVDDAVRAGLSRRDLMRRLGIGAAAVAALPVVESVVAPAIAAAASAPAPTPSPTPGPTPFPTPLPTPLPTPAPTFSFPPPPTPV
jgi:hypothetical protein